MYQKIMVPLDGSEVAECVLPHVEAFISGCQVNTVVLIRVVEPAPAGLRNASTATSKESLERLMADIQHVEEERKSAAEDYLKKTVGRLKSEGAKFQTEVIYGKAAESLIDYAEANNIDMILIATHGRSGVSRWMRGSIADRVLRASKVPVLMVRAPGARRAA